MDKPFDGSFFNIWNNNGQNNLNFRVQSVVFMRPVLLSLCYKCWNDIKEKYNKEKYDKTTHIKQL